MMDLQEAGGVSRRQFVRAAAGGAATLSATGLLAGCLDSGSDSAGNGDSKAGPVQRGGTLTVGQIGFGSAETMNLAMLNSGVDILRQSQILEGLWEFEGRTFGVKQVLAESQELSGTTLNVKLRDGVTWHNGKPFTADDVVWTIKLWEKTPALSNVAELIDFANVRRRGRLEVAIPLTRPVADFPSIPATTWCAYIVPDGDTYDRKEHVGTGPFKLDSWGPGRAVFSANEEYWGGAPYLDKIISDSSFRAEEARFNALLAGEIDALVQLPYELAKTAESNPSIKVLTSATPGYVAPSARIDQPPFNDPRVMQAMKLVADREAIKESVFNGYATIGNDLGMNGAPYFAKDLEHPHDPEKARALLKQAGQEGLTATLVTSNWFAGATNLATVYAQQAKAAGISIQVKEIDASQMYAPTGAYPYLKRQMGMMSWNPTSLAGYYLLGLYTKAPYNETHWGSPEADRLLFDAIGESDEGRATDKWHAVQQLQFDQGGYIIPTNLNYLDATTSKVHGAEVTPSGNDFNNTNFSKTWKSST
jgi:peptide/nickel transport system substrate-binding protein